MKRPQKSNNRRDQILLATAQLFREKTFLGTSIEDIASKVKINKATIYFYFKSKEQMLYEIMSKALERLTGEAQTIVNGDASPATKMEFLIKLHLIAGSDSGNLNGVSKFERRNLSPKLLKHYNAQRDIYEQIYRDLIKEGMTRNQFRDCDPRMMGRFILGLLNSTILWFKKSGPLSIEQMADEIWKMTSRSLLKSPEEGEY
jgi:AcrR family transcriptional regulator